MRDILTNRKILTGSLANRRTVAIVQANRIRLADSLGNRKKMTHTLA